MDFKTAFDTDENSGVWRALREEGIEEPYRQMFTEFYGQQRASVHTDVKSKQFHLKRGTKQGDPPSTLLFITLLQHIMKPLSAKWSRENHGVRFAEHDRDANFSNLRLASGILLISSSLNHTKPMIDDLTIATTEYIYAPRKQKSSPARHQKPETNNTVVVLRDEHRDKSEHQIRRTTRRFQKRSPSRD